MENDWEAYPCTKYDLLCSFKILKKKIKFIQDIEEKIKLPYPKHHKIHEMNKYKKYQLTISVGSLGL